MFEKTLSDISINITSRHAALTGALKADIEEKIQRLERYLGKLREAHVILNFEGKIHVCEANLSGKSLKLASRGTSHDMYQSIEACFAKLERQVLKVKDKRVKHRGSSRTETLNIRHGLIAPLEEGRESKVVKSRRHAVKPMSVEEAAQQLSESRDEFLVFSNAETGHTNVVYKRKDQHIGLIEPEY